MYSQLTEQERYTLAALRQQGLSCRAIARILGRNPSTISRETRRNSCMATDVQAEQSPGAHTWPPLPIPADSAAW